MDTDDVEALARSVKRSREHALRGDYATALAYHDGAVRQASRAAAAAKARHDRDEHRRWLRVKAALEKEFAIVKQLDEECARFRRPPGARTSSRPSSSRG